MLSKLEIRRILVSTRKDRPVKNNPATIATVCNRLNQLAPNHSTKIPTACLVTECGDEGKRGAISRKASNVAFGAKQNFAWNANHPLLRCAACGSGKCRNGCCGDVLADDGEIATVEFQDVRAA